MNSQSVREPYQGVLQILRFNWPFYLAAAMTILAAMLALPFLHPIWRVALLIAVAPALFWLASSLIVSHYVYDRFPLYDLNWISRVLSRTPKRWVNIHSGFDETSGLLAAIFPSADCQVLNIYDPQTMTEGSIQKAQGRSDDAIPSVAARYDALPLSSDSFDATFLIFAAHELRHHEQRVKFFKEVARIMVPDGDVLLVEHSRDFWNFVAFGPGFLHFFSQRAWRKTAFEAGLTLRTEVSMTRFVHVYNLRKAA